MKINQNGHDFADAQAGGSIALACGSGNSISIKVHKFIEFAKMFR